MAVYKIRMTIGDWNGDGHEKSESYIVASNKPVEIVRDAHFEIKQATGISIEGLCSLTGEDELDEETVEILKDLGFKFANPTGMGDEVINPDEMARIWVFLLQKAKPGLLLNIIDDSIPELHFTGPDSQGRRIGTVGYGLFQV